MISYKGVYKWKLFSLLKQFNWKMARSKKRQPPSSNGHAGAALCCPQACPPWEPGGSGRAQGTLLPPPLCLLVPTHPSAVSPDATSGML